MRAAMLYGFGDLRVEEVPDPVPGPDDVVIDVACVQPLRCCPIYKSILSRCLSGWT